MLQVVQLAASSRQVLECLLLIIGGDLADQALQATINHLRGLQETGRLAGAGVERAGLELGRSRRSMYRLLAATDTDERCVRKPYALSDGHLVELGIARGNATLAWQALRDRGVMVPGLRTFQRAANRALDPARRALVTVGQREYRKYQLALLWEVAGRNLVWHSDHKQIPVLVTPRQGTRPIRPWLTSFEDAYSRCVTGYAITDYPNSDTILDALGSAISTVAAQPGGIPEVIVADGGLDYVSTALRQATGRLGAYLSTTPPYTPEQNGKIERFHGTIEQQFFTTLPGYQSGSRKKDGSLYGPNLPPMSLARLTDLTQAWIHRYNTERIHSSIDATPLSAWMSDSTPIVEAPAQLLHLLLRRVERTVRKRGIRLDNRHFTAPELNGLVGQEVEVGRFTHDLRSVEIFREDDWLCTAFPDDTLTQEQRDAIIAQRQADRAAAAKFMRRVAARARVRMQALTSPEDPTIVTTYRSEDLIGLGHDPERVRRRSKTNLLDITPLGDRDNAGV